MLMNNSQPFSKLVRGMSFISVSFVYTGLLVRAFPHLHRLNLTYYSKSSVLLTFCFLFICIIDPTHICLSPISLELLQLFQGILCNNERMKGGEIGYMNYWGRDKLE